jgi:small subunit ribosomal protein S9
MTANVLDATRRYIEGIGRRKTAIARVRIVPEGTGVFLVNERPWEQYFPTVDMQKAIRDPFDIAGMWGQFDVSVRVAGGGVHAQAGAVKLGAARALEKFDEKLRKPLRATDALTRDPRKKERKKPGLKRARRAPQWQKR